MQGEVKLTDFGLAKTLALDGGSNSGLLKGKLAYMAPEQVRGEPVGPAADVFALGAVLYELVSGRRLYPPDIALGDLLMRVNDARFEPLDVVAPGISPAVKALITRCLATSPADRPESGNALASALLGAAEDARLRATALEVADWLLPLANARRLVVERAADGTIVARKPSGSPQPGPVKDAPEPTPNLEATAAAGRPIRTPSPPVPARAAGTADTRAAPPAPGPTALEDTQLAAVPPRRSQTMRLDPADLPAAPSPQPPRGRSTQWLWLTAMVIGVGALAWSFWPPEAPDAPVSSPDLALRASSASLRVALPTSSDVVAAPLPSPMAAPDVTDTHQVDVELTRPVDETTFERRDPEPEVGRVERLTLSVLPESAPGAPPDLERLVRVGPHRDRVAVGGVINRTIQRDGITATFRVDVGRGSAAVNMQARPFVEVRLDGAPLGPTPARFSLRPGRHKVELIRPGLPPVVIPLVLRNGRDPE